MDYYGNSDNEGHIYIKVRNEGNVTKSIKQGDAIAQGIFMVYNLADNDDFSGAERIGGLGSTG